MVRSVNMLKGQGGTFVYCICADSPCMCINQVLVPDDDPLREKILSGENNYVIPCASCQAGVHMNGPASQIALVMEMSSNRRERLGQSNQREVSH